MHSTYFFRHFLRAALLLAVLACSGCSPRDRLEGSVTLIKAGGKEQVIAFTAKLGETYRF